MKPLSKDAKKIIILGSLTAAAITAAVVSFVIYFANANKKGPGWYAVSSDERVVSYITDISLYYYFDNDDNSREFDDLRQYYTTYLREACVAFDGVTTYDELPNIATLNNHLGEDVKVDEVLYTTLQNAYQLTLEDNNYSIFEAPVKNFWNRILQMKDSYVSNDPLNNAENAEFLTSLVSEVKDMDNFSLEFKDNNVIKFSISEEYKALLKENYLDSEIISLNDLQNSFAINYVESKLKEKGFKSGFLVDMGGNFSALENCPESELKLYDSTNLKDSFQFSTLKIEKGMKVSQLNRFNREYDVIDKSYLINKDDVSYLRSAYVNLDDGYDSGLKLFSVTTSSSKSIVEVALQNINSTRFKNVTDLNNYFEANASYNLIYRLTDEQNKIHASSAIKSKIELQRTGYEII